MKFLRLKREQEGPFFLLHYDIANVTQSRNARLTSRFTTSVRQHQAWKHPFHCEITTPENTSSERWRWSWNIREYFLIFSACGQLVDSFLIPPFQAEQLSIACPRSVNAWLLDASIKLSLSTGYDSRNLDLMTHLHNVLGLAKAFCEPKKYFRVFLISIFSEIGTKKNIIATVKRLW